MDLSTRIDMTPDTAAGLYREYLVDRHYSTRIDDEIRRTYRQIAKGETVIRALDAIRDAGVNAQGLPALAIVRAINPVCYFQRSSDGAGCFAATPQHLGRHRSARDMAFHFPAGTFATNIGQSWRVYEAMAPLIPPKFRPRKHLEKYHLLWEAEWTPAAPVDPLLLRRLGAG